MNTFKKYRNRASMRQIEVAEVLGVRQTTVSMWEAGKSRPRTELLPKLAAIYNCTVDELLASHPQSEAS